MSRVVKTVDRVLAETRQGALRLSSVKGGGVGVS